MACLLGEKKMLHPYLAYPTLEQTCFESACVGQWWWREDGGDGIDSHGDIEMVGPSLH